MTGYKKRTIDIFSGGDQDQISLGLIQETPLSIRVQGKAYTMVMRTPGEELAHVAGFCLAEGIVGSFGDFETLGYCDEDVNVVTATLKPERVKKIPDILNRKGFISQTSCGICGKELIDDIKQNITSVPKEMKLDINVAAQCLNRLSDCQTRRHCSHTAAIFTPDGRLLSVGEDVGRHNALDKSIGTLLINETLNRAGIVVMSSRISYELVQKAARAKILAIFSVSGPTALAVELADSLDMAIVCRNKKESLFVFCGGHRFASRQKEKEQIK